MCSYIYRSLYLRMHGRSIYIFNIFCFFFLYSVWAVLLTEWHSMCIHNNNNSYYCCNYAENEYKSKTNINGSDWMGTIFLFGAPWTCIPKPIVRDNWTRMTFFPTKCWIIWWTNSPELHYFYILIELSMRNSNWMKRWERNWKRERETKTTNKDKELIAEKSGKNLKTFRSSIGFLVRFSHTQEREKMKNVYMFCGYMERDQKPVWMMWLCVSSFIVVSILFFLRIAWLLTSLPD